MSTVQLFINFSKPVSSCYIQQRPRMVYQSHFRVVDRHRTLKRDAVFSHEAEYVICGLEVKWQ
jgi:hypothetical protein